MIKIMPTSMLLFIMPLGTGLDKSARGLAALHYEMLPAAGQVVCGVKAVPCQKPQLAERLSGGQE